MISKLGEPTIFALVVKMDVAHKSYGLWWRHLHVLLSGNPQVAQHSENYAWLKISTIPIGDCCPDVI
jgi:hypothetical protein